MWVGGPWKWGQGRSIYLGVGLHPPPRESEKLGRGLDPPPPAKVKNSAGGVRAKKARCSLAMESTKKLAKFLTGLFSSKTTHDTKHKT